MSDEFHAFVYGPSEQWEALCVRAASHANLGPDAEDDDPRSAEHIDGCDDPRCCWPVPDQAAGLALFARLMAVAMRSIIRGDRVIAWQGGFEGCRGVVIRDVDSGYVTIRLADDPESNKVRDRIHGDTVTSPAICWRRDYVVPDDYPGCLVPVKDRARYDREVAIFGSPSEKLMQALRSFHAGTNRGELKALLCEAWGASPTVQVTPGWISRAEGLRLIGRDPKAPMRNYEIEMDLERIFGGKWTIAGLCPFNGTFTRSKGEDAPPKPAPCQTCGGSGASPGGQPCLGCEGTGSPDHLKSIEPSDLRGLAARESGLNYENDSEALLTNPRPQRKPGESDADFRARIKALESGGAPYYDPVTGRCPHGTRYPHECRDGCEDL